MEDYDVEYEDVAFAETLVDGFALMSDEDTFDVLYSLN